MTPDEFTNDEIFLNVSEDHILYVHDWGKQDAKTVYVYLHGGPGSGCGDNDKNLFNPHTMRVIFFDQRGCGKSTPYGSLKDNTTQDLMSDVSKIADHLGIEKFVLVGRSWGACLALAYTIAEPTRVTAIVTGGVFTGNSSEIAFLEEGQFRDFFPDAWDKFLAKTPKAYQTAPAKYHMKRMLGPDVAAARESAYAYSELELSVLRLDDRTTTLDPSTFDPVPVTIEVHYMTNLCFMEDNFVMDNAHKIAVPVWIVQGRYDAICKPASAYELHKRLPHSKLLWTMAGHSKNDRANFDVTKTIIESLA